MKPLLFVLLAASLVANVALVLASRHAVPTASTTASASPSAPAGGNSAPAAASGRPAVAATTSPASAASAAAVPFAWRAAATDQDLHRVVAGLRAAGYPASVIRAVINQLLTERFASRQPNAGLPFWKRAQPIPESASAQAALNNERQALFETLLGPDARASALLDADGRERRYGSLPNDKIDAIARIERDYNEMSAESWAKRKGNAVTSMDAMMQSQQLMEKEKLADLANVLTPDELAQYEMRNSRAAGMLFNNLRNVDVTEAEYARLYQAQKAFDATSPMRSSIDQTTYLQRMTAQLTLNDAARAVLGDERFYPYVEGADSMYALTARALNQYPSVKPAAMYQVYQLQVELQGLITQSPLNRPGSGEDQQAAMRNLVEGYNARLESLLGPTVADAYRNQGMGQIFKAFRPPPKPATPVAK